MEEVYPDGRVRISESNWAGKGISQRTLTPAEYAGLSFVQLENAQTNSYNAPPATPGQQRQYIVRSGDTLSGIAQRELGDANRWREIQKPGGGTFTEAEARNLPVGQSVYLPVSYQAGPGTPVTPTPSQGTPAHAVSEAGLRFIAQHEGTRLNLYNDPAGHCTIGVGHLVHYGNCNGSEPAEFRAGISEQRAYELLRSDVNAAVQAVKSLVKVPLNQQQFDALVSFTFNLGAGNLQQSDLLKRLNAGEYSAVPYELSRWVYGGGVKLPGLVRRRNEEGILFRDGIYTGVANVPVNVTPKSTPNQTGSITWVNFSGTVGPSIGVNLRNSPRFSDRSSRNEPNSKRLEFDAWTYGEVGIDMWNGNQDARWFKVKGTNLWVPSAYINGNPPNSSPMPNGSNPIPESKTPSPLPKTPSHEDYQTLVSKAYSSYTKGQAVGVDDYTVNEIFGNPNSGFYALGLYSDTKPPVFVIRGTGDADDIFDDTNPQSIGYGQFSAYQSQILAWLEKAGREKGRTPDITGHSLGGAIAQLVAANFPTKVKQVVTFNSPGISRSMANHFSSGGANKNDVTHYIVSGDLVSMAGEAYIAGRVSLISYLDIPNDLKAVNPIS